MQTQSDAVMRQAVAETLGDLGDESKELFLESLADIIANMDPNDLIKLSTHLRERMPRVSREMAQEGLFGPSLLWGPAHTCDEADQCAL
jgi:hypothetical protein